MANILAIGLLAVITILVVMQVAYVVLYVLRLKRSLVEFQLADSNHSNEPEGSKNDNSNVDSEVAVVLCLRGADPALASCLQGLSKQTHSLFQLHIVVDSLEDPALKVVHEFSSGMPGLQVYPIGKRHKTCSAKCSAILSAVEKLPSSVEIIAFVDADSAPDLNWLSDLIAPFKDARIGASTGDRWFESDQWSFGTALRQVWNVAAIVQMEIYNIAWGGSLAIRRELLNTTKFLDRWQHAFCEDTLLTDELKRTGLKLARAPGLFAVNRETTSFFDAVNWITRQLLTVRLHHSNWPLIQAHAFATMCCNLALLLGLMIVIWGQNRLGWLLLAAFSIYQITNALMLWWIHSVVTENLKNRSARSHQTNDHASPSLVLLGLAILSAQWVYPYACCAATFCRRIRWRGIEYAISGKGEIEMVAYNPFSPSPKSARKDNSDSIH